MGENGVAREQIHTKRCHFESLHVLVLIQKQLPGFRFFFSPFVFFSLPPPPQHKKTLAELQSHTRLCLLRAADPSPVPQNQHHQNLTHVPPASLTCVFFLRCYEKCSPWVCEVIKYLVGGAAPGSVRCNKNNLISVRLGRPGENQQPSHRASSVEVPGPDFKKNKKPM